LDASCDISPSAAESDEQNYLRDDGQKAEMSLYPLTTAQLNEYVTTTSSLWNQLTKPPYTKNVRVVHRSEIPWVQTKSDLEKEYVAWRKEFYARFLYEKAADAAVSARQEILALRIESKNVAERVLAALSQPHSKDGDTSSVTPVINTTIKASVDASLAPYKSAFARAALECTPPQKRLWWQNLRALYHRQAGLSETQKWHAVAHVVYLGAQELRRKMSSDSQSQYLSPVMLRHLLDAMAQPNADQNIIEVALASKLSKYVRREEGKARTAR
jgi:hypothetical protein